MNWEEFAGQPPHNSFKNLASFYRGHPLLALVYDLRDALEEIAASPHDSHNCANIHIANRVLDATPDLRARSSSK